MLNNDCMTAELRETDTMLDTDCGNAGMRECGTSGTVHVLKMLAAGAVRLRDCGSSTVCLQTSTVRLQMND